VAALVETLSLFFKLSLFLSLPLPLSLFFKLSLFLSLSPLPSLFLKLSLSLSQTSSLFFLQSLIRGSYKDRGEETK
jgi:hypothetical protein